MAAETCSPHLLCVTCCTVANVSIISAYILLCFVSVYVLWWKIDPNSLAPSSYESAVYKNLWTTLTSIDVDWNFAQIGLLEPGLLLDLCINKWFVYCDSVTVVVCILAVLDSFGGSHYCCYYHWVGHSRCNHWLSSWVDWTHALILSFDWLESDFLHCVGLLFFL